MPLFSSGQDLNCKQVRNCVRVYLTAGCCGSRPAALACLLSAVGLFRVATGDGQPIPCLACCMFGVPGQDWEGSWSPAEIGVRVEEEEEDAGDVERVASPASFRGCS